MQRSPEGGRDQPWWRDVALLTLWVAAIDTGLRVIEILLRALGA